MKERDAEEMKLFNAVKHICSLNDALWDLERMDRTDLSAAEIEDLRTAENLIEGILNIETVVADNYLVRLGIDADPTVIKEMDALNMKLTLKLSKAKRGRQ